MVDLTEDFADVSPWLRRYAELLPAHARVLDLACGRGRHARWLAARGCEVLAVDRDAEALAALQGVAGVTTRLLDLESDDWPLGDERFDAVVVTNYLHRPHFAALLACVADGGSLLYETFMAGNESFGKPSNPDFLLATDELYERVRAGGLTVVAFEQGEIATPRAACVQRVVARRGVPKLPG